MKPHHRSVAGLAAAALTLAGCIGPMAPPPPLAPPPMSPVAMTPDQRCRDWAESQIAPLRAQANANTVGSTLMGAGLGAALGGAIGGGRGAAIGAASGGALGLGSGAANAQYAAMDLQQRYNMYYAECMSPQAMPPAGYAPPGGYAPPPAGYSPAPYPGAPVPPPPRGY